MTSYELSEWMAYSSLEPFGEIREDYRAGLICATIANASGNYKKHLTPDDFISIFKQNAVSDRKYKMQQQIKILMDAANG